MNNLLNNILFLMVSTVAFGQLNVVSESKTKPNAIIFIHGLASNSKDCWTNDDFFFPKEFAKDELLKDYSVFTFDYPSTCNNVSPSEAAVSLKDAIEMDNLKFNSIHIVAHSLGGIVTREFLTKYPNMKVSSIQLLGTPNLGSSYEKFAWEFCRAAGIDRIRTLGVKRGDVIDHLNDNWRVMYEQNDGKKSSFKFFAAFENPQGITLDPVIVEKDSALLFSSSIKYFTVGHRGISKPETKNDHIYKWVRNNILKPETINEVTKPTSTQETRYVAMESQIAEMRKTAGDSFAKKFVKTFNLRLLSKARELLFRESKVPEESKKMTDALLFDYQNKTSEAISKYMLLKGNGWNNYGKSLTKELVERNCAEKKINCIDIQNLKKLDLKDDQIQFLEKEVFKKIPDGFA